MNRWIAADALLAYRRGEVSALARVGALLEADFFAQVRTVVGG